MSPRRMIIFALLGVLALGAAAWAESIVFWRHNPITPQAIASDPALAGRWASVGLRASLPQGLHFYNVPTSLGGGWFHPTAPAVALHPALAYDTYVSSPLNQTGSNAPAVFGPFPENEPPESFGGPSDPVPGRFSVSWGDPIGREHPLDTFELARWTFPSGTTPTIHPASVVWYVLPDRMVLIPTTLPEATVPGIAIVALLLRHWTRRPNRS